MEELLIAFLNLLGEMLGEMLLQLIAQIFAEIVARGLAAILAAHAADDTDDIDPRALRPVLAFFCCAGLGAIMGGISVALLPKHMIHVLWHRWLNLLITPVVVGWTMAAYGGRQDRLGRRAIPLDHFWNGWICALAFALVRYRWCS